MIKNVISTLAGFAAAAALAGCSMDDGVTVTRSEITQGFTGALYVQTQAQEGINSVLVRNSPFPQDAVVTALQARYQSNQYRFAPGPNPAGWNGYTVVLSFGGPTVGTQNLCQNFNAPQLAVPANRTEVIGDYCYGDRVVAEASGRAAAVTGPQDPRLQALLGDVVAELFKNDYNIYHKSGGNGPNAH